ncbi:MAG TPA: tRNA epoxyqueuosine(34) reductase QueG [Verrucomicrobiae bacterium]|nr:tRNA epoxyqueuosine(34) reductase QueG [Verrucomicrobiae bacterium]
MKEVIRRKARELGFDECRFTSAQAPGSGAEFQRWLEQGQHGEMNYLARNAHKRLDPQQVLPGASTVVVLAASYFSEPTDVPRVTGHGSPASPAGVVARYAGFRDYHDVLGPRLTQLARFMDASSGPGARSLWYVDTGPLLERDFAQRAGVGFVGKHTNVISRRLGNWTFLAEIITTIPIEPDPPEHNRCGSCVRCIRACPTGAITAPFQLDARICISYLTIELKGAIPVHLRPAIGNRIYGCDDCLAACPWNRFAKEGSLMRQHARPELQTLELLALLKLDPASFKERFAGTPMLRTKRRGLLRNVCVALGNVGDTSALPALEAASRDPEPLIAEHARWAMDQISKKQA